MVSNEYVTKAKRWDGRCELLTDGIVVRIQSKGSKVAGGGAVMPLDTGHWTLGLDGTNGYNDG